MQLLGEAREPAARAAAVGLELGRRVHEHGVDAAPLDKVAHEDLAKPRGHPVVRAEHAGHGTPRVLERTRRRVAHVAHGFVVVVRGAVFERRGEHLVDGGGVAPQHAEHRVAGLEILGGVEQRVDVVAHRLRGFADNPHVDRRLPGLVCAEPGSQIRERRIASVAQRLGVKLVLAVHQPRGQHGEHRAAVRGERSVHKPDDGPMNRAHARVRGHHPVRWLVPSELVDVGHIAEL